MATRLGNYEWVDQYKDHLKDCSVFPDLRLSDVEVRIWNTGSVDIRIADRGLSKVRYCPFCGKKLSKK